MDKSKFKERLKTTREAYGIDRASLAEHLNFSESTIRNYENGVRLPDYDSLIKISELLNVSIDYLLGVTDSFSPDENLKAIWKDTGLKNETLKSLRKNNSQLKELCEQKKSGISFEQLKDLENSFLQSDFFTYIVVSMYRYSKNIKDAHNFFDGKKEIYLEYKDSLTDLFYYQLTRFFLTYKINLDRNKKEISDCFNAFLDSYCGGNFETVSNKYYKLIKNNNIEQLKALNDKIDLTDLDMADLVQKILQSYQKHFE